MLGHLGFSYVGLICLLMLIIPNMLWASKSAHVLPERRENRILLTLERIGQAGICCTALIFSDFNISSDWPWSIWLILSFALLVLYEICWVRYFQAPTEENFYKSFLWIPLPLASLPAVAFFFLGLYGKVIWLIIAAVLFGIGHIGIHRQNR